MRNGEYITYFAGYLKNANDSGALSTCSHFEPTEEYGDPLVERKGHILLPIESWETHQLF